jgi:hypothetical protein
MARNSADVVDHEIDAMLSAGDHDQDEANALAAINESWFDESERTGVLEPRHLMAQLLPQSAVAAESRAREPASEQRPIQRAETVATEDPRWDDASEKTSYGEGDSAVAAWEMPDLSGAGEWEEEAKTEYFERTANFELLDSKFVSEYTDRLPGGLSELLASDADSAVSARPRPQRKSGVRESARVLPPDALLAEPSGLRDPREVSAPFAYEVAPEAPPASKQAQRSLPVAARPTVARKAKATSHKPTLKRRTGSETIRDRGRTTVRAESTTSDPIDFESDGLNFDEASVATVRGGRRFEPKSDGVAQRPTVSQRTAAAPRKHAKPAPSQPAAAAQWFASQPTPPPTYDTDSLRPLVARSTRPSVPSQPAALPVTAGYDSDFAELREHRRHQIAAWVWLTASALSGVALILVIRAWTTQPLPIAEPVQQPSVAVETTVNAAQQGEPGFSITSRPEGAHIFVDGKPTGFITPANIKRLSPGLHSVELKLDGYYDTTLPAALPEHSTLELAPVEMRPHPSEPAAAAAPTGAIVPQLIAASRSHGKSRETRRWHRRGITRNAPVRLLDERDTASASAANGAGTLRINSRPWARVMVDNKFVGNTPQRGLKVAAGEHSVKLVNEPLNMSKTFRVVVRDGETVTRVEMLNEDADRSQVSRASSGDSYAKAGR